jgi:NAD(P)-dependent dehydrogenase (short-subunit alcohol dehydrogenase family)
VAERTVVITGASRGIGYATALAFATLGDRVVIAARSGELLTELAQQAQEAGGRARAILCDISREDQVSSLMRQAAGSRSHIDVLVNAAGAAIAKPLEQVTLDEWQAVLDSNLKGTFLCAKHALPYLHHGSVIVNLLAFAAREGYPHWTTYAAAKWALDGFTRAIREEVRKRGIRVISVVPYPVDTPMWDQLPGRWPRDQMLRPEEVADAIVSAALAPADLFVEEIVLSSMRGIQ